MRPGAAYPRWQAWRSPARRRPRTRCASGAGLIDRSARGKLALSGPEAKAALNALVTNEIETLQPGGGLYAAVLTPKGKMLGDLRVLDTGDELLLDTERAALQGVFDALRHGLVGFDAELHKRTLQRGLLSLIGPQSRTVAGAPDLAAAEHANQRRARSAAPTSCWPRPTSAST